MSKIQKLTPEILRKIVLEEKDRLMKEGDPLADGIDNVEKVKTDEVEPSDLADTLAKNIDMMRALKIEENKLLKKLDQIRESRLKIRRAIDKVLS